MLLKREFQTNSFLFPSWIRFLGAFVCEGNFLLPKTEGHHSEWSTKTTSIFLRSPPVSTVWIERPKGALMQTAFACVGSFTPKPRTNGSRPAPLDPFPTVRRLDAVNVWPFNHHEGERPRPLDPSQPCAGWMPGTLIRSITTKGRACPLDPSPRHIALDGGIVATMPQER